MAKKRASIEEGINSLGKTFDPARAEQIRQELGLSPAKNTNIKPDTPAETKLKTSTEPDTKTEIKNVWKPYIL